MKKKKRHDLIKKMIKEEKLGTQKDIQTRLEEEGIYVTQTTLSRDLREIGLIKVKKNGQLYYVLAQETARIDLTEVLSYHTRLGEAAVLANIIDENRDERILGSLAGADTLLLICRNQDTAKEIEEQILAKM